MMDYLWLGDNFCLTTIRGATGFQPPCNYVLLIYQQGGTQRGLGGGGAAGGGAKKLPTAV